MVRRKIEGFSQAAEVASAIHLQDQAASEREDQERRQRSKLPLDKIYPRSQDTRSVKDGHVMDLATSIAALGLIEPLVVDLKGRLLAGGHRLAAIRKLSQEQPEVFKERFPDNLVPVYMMAFDAELEPERALQVELAENEKRVNYSRDQIEQLADRLRSLNYRDVPGRPKAGEKALGPALAVAIGVSTRYVQKVLTEQKNSRSGEAKPREQESSGSQKLKKLETLLQQVSVELLQEAGEKDLSLSQAKIALAEALPEFLQKVRGVLAEPE